MTGSIGRVQMATAAVLALIAGVAIAALCSRPARADSSYNWIAYNLSSETGGQQAAGIPSLLADPNTGAQTAVTDSPGGSIIQWGGDGADGTNAYNITSFGSGTASTGSPSAIADPQSGDFDIFTVAGGALEQYDRTSSNFVWTAYNQSTSSGDSDTLTGNPSAAVQPGTSDLTAAAETTGGHLIFFLRQASGFAWSYTDVTSTTNTTISGNPDAIVDPLGYISIFANSGGHLLQFAEGGNTTWVPYDQTTGSGGQTISGDPTAYVLGGTVYVFAQGANGNLIEFTRNPSSLAWTSQNLTTLSGGPSISSQPAVVADPSGGFDVFAEGSNEHLIEYSGSGTSWSGSDLTATAGAPTVGAAPAATVSTQTHEVAVYVTTPAGAEIELERTPAPVVTTSTTTTVYTQTVITTPATPKGKAKKTVKVQPVMNWTWGPVTSELVWIHLGKVKATEGFSMACHGTNKKHPRVGCPYLKKSAKGKLGIARLIRQVDKTRYRVGDVVTVTVSEPGLLSKVARLTIRASRVPLYPK